jgi:hypothetical protein
MSEPDQNRKRHAVEVYSFDFGHFGPKIIAYKAGEMELLNDPNEDKITYLMTGFRYDEKNRLLFCFDVQVYSSEEMEELDYMLDDKRLKICDSNTDG